MWKSKILQKRSLYSWVFLLLELLQETLAHAYTVFIVILFIVAQTGNGTNICLGELKIDFSLYHRILYRNANRLIIASYIKMKESQSIIPSESSKPQNICIYIYIYIVWFNLYEV